MPVAQVSHLAPRSGPDQTSRCIDVYAQKSVKTGRRRDLAGSAGKKKWASVGRINELRAGNAARTAALQINERARVVENPAREAVLQGQKTPDLLAIQGV